MDTIEPSDSSVSVVNWWDHHHSGKGNYGLWLTGSTGTDVWHSLKIDDYIYPQQTILNIGVGLGSCTRSLAEIGCVVHVLDISQGALEKVKSVVKACWLPETFCDVPENTFDLAISNLVSQHMRDDDLVCQIEGVISSLKPDGIFAMQFAFAWDSELNDLSNPEDTLVKGGGVCRTLGRMVQLVQSAGGTVVWAERIGMYPNYRSGWYALHIVRTDFPSINSVSRRRSLVTRIASFVHRFLS